MIIYAYVEGDSLEEFGGDDDLVAAEMPEVAQSPIGVTEYGVAEVPCFLYRGRKVVLAWSPGDGSLTHVHKLPPAPKLDSYGSDNKKATALHGTLVHVDEYLIWLREKESFLEVHHAVKG